MRASVDYQVFDKEAGALYNWRNTEKRPTFVFGWELDGAHVHDLARTLPGLYDNWVRGLKGIPGYQSWKIHIGSEVSSTERTEELSELVLENSNPAIVQLLCDDIARTQELTRQRKRSKRFIRLYVYYWGSRDRLQGDSEDAIESGIREAIEFFNDCKALMSGRKSKTDAERIESIFRTSYYNGFQVVENLLQGTFGIGARAMTHDQIWSNLRKRFSNETPGPSPYKITCTINQLGVTLHEEMQSTHIANALVRDFLPILTSHGVQIKKWDPESEGYQEDFIAVLEARQKFEGWAHEYHQVKGLWDLSAVDKIKDVELFIEISGGSAKAQRENAQDIHRQAAKRQAEAIKRGEYNAYADQTLKEAKQIMGDFFGGDKPLRIAFVVLVHADSVARLDLACRDVQSHFSLCPLERETACASRVWLQTLPCFEDHLLQLKIKILNMGYPLPPIGIDFRHFYSTKQAIGLLGWATTHPNDSMGIEFVSRDRQTIYLDVFSHGKEKHWLCTARQRKGKSYIGIDIGDYAQALFQPVTILDSPPADASSSLKDRARFVNGSHIDVHRESFNILGIPSALLLASSNLSAATKADRYKILQGFWIEILMILGGPTESEEHLAQVTKDLLQLAIDLYIKDPDIQRRYMSALEGGFGSPEWSKMPTLADFVKFTKRYKLQQHLSKIQGAVDQALDLLDLRLSRKADPSTLIGAAISRPSTVDVEASLYTVFSLHGLRAGSEESLAYCLAAYTSAMQKSLAHPISHVIVEEAQTLADFPGVLQIISDIATRGGKAGVRLGVISNSFDAIAQSKAGKALLNNLTTKMIGSIESTSVKSLSETLSIPIELVEQCASSNFDVNRAEGCSHWLLADYGKHTFVKRYPGWVSASLSGSQGNERSVRFEFMSAIEDQAVAIAAYARWFRQCAEANKPVQPLPKDQIMELAKLCSAD